MSSFTPMHTRAALFLPPERGDAADAYAAALELFDGDVPSLTAFRWETSLEDRSARFPAWVLAALGDERLDKAADLVEQGARRLQVTVEPEIGPDTLQRYRLGSALLVVAVDAFRRGEVERAVRLTLTVHRYANDLMRHSLLGGAVFTSLARRSARATRAMVGSAGLDRAQLLELAGAFDRLRLDAASPIEALLAESYLLDKLLLAGPRQESPLSPDELFWKKSMKPYGDDYLDGYAELNGRLNEAWHEAAASPGHVDPSAVSEEAIGACNRILGVEDSFCDSLPGLFGARAEADIYLRDAQIAVLSRLVSPS